MPRIISHRGLTSGPDKNRENNPKYIEECIKLGFDVEIDLWSGKEFLSLGHDKPEYEVKSQWLEENANNLFIHCKDLRSLNSLIFLNTVINHFKDKENTFHYFWHENDQYTLTSNNLIWQAHTKEVSNNSIIVDLNLENDYNSPKLKHVYGVCTDYPFLLKERLNEGSS
jgi:hypothetical protein